MPVTITQFPQRDAGTGEHSQAEGPQTFTADDVTNQPEKAADLPAEVTTVAHIDPGPDDGAPESAGPVTVQADWPKAEDKTAKDAEAKTTDKPAKRAAKGS